VTHTHTHTHTRARAREGSAAVLMAALRGSSVCWCVATTRWWSCGARPSPVSTLLLLPFPLFSRSFFSLSLQRARNPGVGSARPGKYAPDKGDPPAVESLCSDYPRLPRRDRILPAGFATVPRSALPCPPLPSPVLPARSPDDELTENAPPIFPIGLSAE